MEKNNVLTDNEFRALLALNKFFEKTNSITTPVGKAESYALTDASGTKKFYLDVDRGGRIELGRKIKLQNRYRTVTLVRFEINGPYHTNPDGTHIGRNHIHIYREGFDDAWAFELSDFSEIDFSSCESFDDYLNVFCEYCHIEKPEIQLSSI